MDVARMAGGFTFLNSSVFILALVYQEVFKVSRGGSDGVSTMRGLLKRLMHMAHSGI